MSETAGLENVTAPTAEEVEGHSYHGAAVPTEETDQGDDVAGSSYHGAAVPTEDGDADQGDDVEGHSIRGY